MSNELRYKMEGIKTFIVFDDYGKMTIFKARTLIEARQKNPDALLIKYLNDVKYFIDQYEKNQI